MDKKSYYLVKILPVVFSSLGFRNDLVEKWNNFLIIRSILDLKACQKFKLYL